MFLAERYIINFLRVAAVTDDKCHYDFEGGCLKMMSYTFKQEVIAGKREFTIYYKKQIDLKEGK